MSSLVGALRISLGLDSAAFETGAKRAGAEINAFGSKAEQAGFKVGSFAKAAVAAGSALAGAAIVQKLKDMVVSGLEYASSLSEAAQQMGVTVESLQQFRLLAQQSGVAQETMDKALQKLTRTMGEAAAGGKKQAAVFSELGINIRDANGNVRDAGTLLPELAGALEKIKSPAERARIEVGLFGKAGQDLEPLLGQGETAIRTFMDQAAKAGIIISKDLADKADSAADKIGFLQTKLEMKWNVKVAEHADEIQKIADNLDHLIDKFFRLIDAMERFGNSPTAKLLAKLNGVAQAVNPLGGVIDNAGAFVDMAAPAPGAKAPPVPKGAWNGASFGGPVLGRGTFKQGAGPLTHFAGGGLDLGSSLDVLAGLKGGLAVDRLAALSQGMGLLKTETAATVPQLSAFSKGLDSVALEKQVGKQSIDEFTASLASLRAELFPEAVALEEYRAKLAIIDRALREHRITVDEATEARKRLAMAGRESASVIADQIANDDLQTRVGTILGGMGDITKAANDNADKTGIATVRIATSFKDMATETISAIQQLSSAVKGGDFLSILSAVVGLGMQLASIGVFGKSAQTSVNAPKVPAYAGGTGFHPGGLALVGERGPELVGLPRGSRVWPSGTGPGGGGTQNFYLQGNLMTPEFWQQINAGHAMAAQAGGEIGFRKVTRAGSRRLA